MGFRDKVHEAIAAKKPSKKPLGSTVYVDIDDADRREAADDGATGGASDENAWLVTRALQERFFAQCWLSCVVEEEGVTMRITPATPDSLL